MVQSQKPKDINSKSSKRKQEKNKGRTPQLSHQLVMQGSVPFANRGNPSSPRVGLVTTKTDQQWISLKSHRWRPTSNCWSMKFCCAAPTFVSFSLMSNQPETPQGNNGAHNREKTMFYLLISQEVMSYQVNYIQDIANHH